MTLPLFRRALALAASLVLGAGIIAVAAPAAHAAPSDTTLSSLAVSAGTLSPAFNPNSTTYSLTVPHTTTSLTVTAIAADGNNSVSVRDSGNQPANPIILRPGMNIATILVTAQDSSQTQYVLLIQKEAAPPGPDVNLAGLTVSEGTLTPAFDSATTLYNVAVPYETASITVTPGSVAPGNTVSVKNSGNVVGNQISLVPGANSAIVTVRAPDSTEKQYVVYIERGPAPTANVNLDSLSISTGVLNPVFDPAVTQYSTLVPFAYRTLQITASAEASGNVITVNNEVVTDGVPRTVTVNFGAVGSSYGIAVTAPNGVSKNYVITINREQPSSNADFTGIAISEGTLSPAYSSTASSYTAAVPYLTRSLTVTAGAADPTAILRVNGRDVASGTASQPVNLNVGTNTVTVSVTAEDGVTETVRTITVTREAPDLDLRSLVVTGGTISPAFAAGTLAYTLALPYTTSSIDIAAAAQNADWSLTINGVATGSSTIAVPVGASTATAKITAQYGESRSYTIAITRQAISADATLSGISLSKGTLSPAFADNITAYTASVAYGVDSITVGATANNEFASVKVNGSTGSSVVPLNVGKNTVTIVATAQNGTTSETTVVVTREAAPVANLAIELGFKAGDASANAPFDVTGTNLRPGSTATVTMFSTPVVLATGTVGTDGTVKLSARIPANAAFGAHRLVFTGTAVDGNPVSTTAWFSAMRNGTIGAVSTTSPVSYSEPAASAAKGTLASTGFDGALALIVGGGLAALGAIAFAFGTVTRRRKTA